jgi:SNF2 family DNA or RNA helicase
MVNQEYEGGSGKLEDVLHKLETVASEHHKILVFSQFVKHLAIIKNCLEDMGLQYAYLDEVPVIGSTSRLIPAIKAYTSILISLKAAVWVLI